MTSVVGVEKGLVVDITGGLLCRTLRGVRADAI